MAPHICPARRPRRAAGLHTLGLWRWWGLRCRWQCRPRLSLTGRGTSTCSKSSSHASGPQALPKTGSQERCRASRDSGQGSSSSSSDSDGTGGNGRRGRAWVGPGLAPQFACTQRSADVCTTAAPAAPPLRPPRLTAAPAPALRAAVQKAHCPGLQRWQGSGSGRRCCAACCWCQLGLRCGLPWRWQPRLAWLASALQPQLPSVALRRVSPCHHLTTHVHCRVEPASAHTCCAFCPFASLTHLLSLPLPTVSHGLRIVPALYVDGLSCWPEALSSTSFTRTLPLPERGHEWPKSPHKLTTTSGPVHFCAVQPPTVPTI